MRSSITLGLASIVTLLAGCGSGGSSTADNSPSTTTTTTATTPGGKTYTIAVIPKGSTHEYWKSVHEGANTAKDELAKQGINVDIKWKGPMLENDKDSQIKVVEDFTNTQVDGIVLAPLDNVALEKPVEDAAKANIPVVVIDSGLEGTGFISTVSTDNEKGGEMAGDELAKELSGKGKVVMLRYEEGSASTDAREKGFLEAIAKNPGITVVSKDQYGGVTAESAQSKSENLLAPYKKGDGLSIDGIYCPNESTTFGMLRCLESAQLVRKVKFVGFDASEKLIDGLTKGEINALVIQNPRKMGYDGVKMIVDYLKGNKNVVKTEDTGATLLTLANMKDPEVAKLIAPPKE